MPVRRLTLNNFRNYHAASLETGAKTIVLVGPNGAGKTNLIEAISFFAPGRGLRRANLDEVAFSEGDGSWAVAAEIEGALGDRKSTRLNSSHQIISYAVFCLKKKKTRACSPPAEALHETDLHPSG